MSRFRPREILLLVLWFSALWPRCGAAQETSSGALIELTQQLNERLEDARRRLAAGDAGPATQAAQTGVVEALDRLITSAQRQEAAERSAGGAGASGAAAVPQEKSAGENAAPLESPAKDDPTPRAGAGMSAVGPPGAWGRLPQREREALLQLLQQRGFPPRYRAILEQYYRSFHSSDARRGKSGPASSE